MAMKSAKFIKPKPPSPFRLALVPEGGVTRHVDLSREVQNLKGAKQSAFQWAGNVGVRGTITIEERVTPTEWKPVKVGDVKDSEFKGWRR